MTTTDAAVLELLERQAIHDVIVRYCRGVDRADAALIQSAYHPDAVDDHSGHWFEGEAIGAGIVDMTTSMRVTLHYVTNMAIEFRGADTARCETYFNSWQTHEHEGVERATAALGRYLDRFERRNGEWKIADRRVITDLVVLQPQLAQPSIPSRGRRGPDDPSYEFFRG